MDMQLYLLHWYVTFILLNGMVSSLKELVRMLYCPSVLVFNVCVCRVPAYYKPKLAQHILL